MPTWNRPTPFVLGSLVLACASSGTGDSDTDAGVDGSTNTPGTQDGSGGLPDPDFIALSTNQQVDILFVVDNTASMANAQTNLAAGMATFVAALEGLDSALDYRVAVTTTDDGHYWCTGGQTTPTSGEFIRSSCRQRLDDFSFEAGGIEGQSACTSACDLEQLQLSPTTTDDDPNPSVRPWLERSPSQTNLPDGVTMAEALACMLPQGIAGCGFEAPLESMWKGLKRADDEGSDEFGFVRDSAVLAVVFVTDEADCSTNFEWEEAVFGPESNQVFWSLPDQQASPTSAACWNAGVTCDGAECVSANKDVMGNPVPDTDAEDLAVLQPVAKYQQFLDAIENAKQELSPGQEVLVMGLVGVPENYPQTQLLQYAPGPNGTDPESFQARFGIGPGCASQVAEAVPPVRNRELFEYFSTSGEDLGSYSVCLSDYTAPLKAIADSISGQLLPACMPSCVADSDAVTEGLQPDCEVRTRVLEDGASDQQTLPPCDTGGTVPAGELGCYEVRWDTANATSDLRDDLSATCGDIGWNLEFAIQWADVPPPGAQVDARCEPSQNQAVDCPGLPS